MSDLGDSDQASFQVLSLPKIHGERVCLEFFHSRHHIHQEAFRKVRGGMNNDQGKKGKKKKTEG